MGNNVIHVSGAFRSPIYLEAHQNYMALEDRRQSLLLKLAKSESHLNFPRRKKLEADLERVSKELTVAKIKLEEIKLEEIKLEEIRKHERTERSEVAQNQRNLRLPSRLHFQAKDHLFKAISRGDQDQVEESIATCTDLNCRNQYGQTPLSFAAQKGKLGIVRLLSNLDRVDRESRDSDGLIPMMLAAKMGHAEIVSHLLGAKKAKEAQNVTENNKPVDLITDKMGRTALSHAAENGHTEALNVLLDRGSNVNSQDKEKKTPLIWAAAGGRNAIVELILKREDIKPKPDPDIKDASSRTAFFWAAHNGNVDTVKALLPRTDNIEAQDIEDHTPLSLAAQYCHKGAAEIIFKKIRQEIFFLPNEEKIYSWATLYVYRAAKKGWTSLSKFLLTEFPSSSIYFDVNFPGEVEEEKNRTPLCYAAINGDTEIIGLLLGVGADIDPADSGKSDTPLCLAVQYNQINSVRCLLEAGANPRKTNWELKTPIEYTEEDQPVIMGMLTKFDADALRLKADSILDVDHKFDAMIVDFFLEKGGETTPSRRSPAVSKILASEDLLQNGNASFTWLHLPVNNMRWIEGIMGKYFKYHYDQAEFAYKALKPERWVDRQNKGPEHVHHARFMRPLCQLIPDFHTPAQTNGTKTSTLTRRDKALVLFMPYLHWEVEPVVKRVKQYTEHLKIKQKGTPTQQPENQGTSKAYFEGHDLDLMETYLYDQHPLHTRRTLDQYYYHTLPNTDKRDREQVGPRYQEDHKNELPESEKILTMVDQLWLWVLTGKNGKADTVVTSFPARANKWSGFQLNVLDSDSAGWTDVPSNILRSIYENKSVVKTPYDLAGVIASECSKVYFNTADPRQAELRLPAIYENAIGDVSTKETDRFDKFHSFIEKEKPLNDETLKNETGVIIQRLYASQPGIDREFIEAISEILGRYHESDQLDLRKAVKSLKKGEVNQIPSIVKALEEIRNSESLTLKLKSLEIGEEIEQLRRVKDILDELNIMFILSENQKRVLTSMEAGINLVLTDHPSHNEANPEKLFDATEFTSDGEVEGKVETTPVQKEKATRPQKPSKNQKRAVENDHSQSKIWQATSSPIPSLPLSIVEQNLQEIKQMIQRATRVYDSLNALIDLKQKQSDAMEARISRKELEESVQLTKAAKRQAEATAKQGETIMVFTVVTILFLPLSFMAAFFAIDITQFPKSEDPQGGLGLGWLSKIMFPISVGTSGILILVAFNVGWVKETWENFIKSLDRLKIKRCFG